ncbi:MAG TPA: prolyl oligopeptidase family serine peptidase [Pyrinomonadaceae bacterium]|nr:prolyl oligopeptidase family serine peptidase [Pyrinomonadaceae bacterium]
MKKLFYLCLVLAVCGCSSRVPPATSNSVVAPIEVGNQTAHSDSSLKYLLYLPSDYTKQKQWPLIVYLHGGSLRGDDVEMLKRYGLASLLDKQVSIPFVVASPQCPVGKAWVDEESEVLALIDHVAATYSIDPDRIYLTGHSLGGRGTWFLASRHPDKFAAIVPMADGPSELSWVAPLKQVPVWTFHGTKDDLAPFERTEQFVNELKTAGGQVKFTPLPDRDHFILDMYENKEIYDWLLQHKRKH